MKAFSICFTILFSLSSLAATEKSQVRFDASKSLEFEPSFTVSSINDGSQFLGIGLMGAVAPWLKLGVEGELPANFDSDAQIYFLRGFVRIPLLDNENQLYIQGALSYGYAELLYSTFQTNIQARNAEFFENLEAMIGYSRHVGGNWSLGGRLGAQYSWLTTYNFNDPDFFGVVDQGPKLYNRATFVATYRF
ncbi:MAG: hypothetical protein AAF203_03575 [Pseudomonadota bacterium]